MGKGSFMNTKEKSLFRVKINIRAILQYLFLYLLLVSNASILYMMFRTIMPYLLIGISSITIILFQIPILKYKNLLIFSIVFVLNLILCRLMNGGIGLDYFFDFFSKAIIVIVAYELNKEKVFQRFLKLVVFLSIISLICFIVQVVNPEFLKNMLIKASYSSGEMQYDYYGLLFYTFRIDKVFYTLRNSSIYTEPGLFQMILIPCLFILLYCPKEIGISSKTANRLLLLLSVTLITTFSATAYISFAILIVGFLFLKSSIDIRSNKKKVMACLSVLICILIIEYYINAENSILEKFLFKKLSETGQMEANENLNSGSARYANIIITFQALRMNPFGIGTTKYLQLAESYGFPDIAGNGLFFYLGALGIIGWTSIILYVLTPAWKNRKNSIYFIIFLIEFIVSTIAQSYIFAPAFLLVSLLNCKSNNKNSVNNKIKIKLQ